MEYDDPLQEEYRLELEACYRGWLHSWTPSHTARYWGVERNFVLLVYTALDTRWPGMGRRRLHDPTLSRPAGVPVSTNDPD